MPVNVTRSSMPPFEEYCEEIRKLWDSHWLTNMGTEHETLERELESFLSCPNVVLFTNGHLALESAIAAFDFPKGGEVITTPFTFVSTTHAITRNGLKPVFCDIEREHYTIDAGKIEELITEKTVAIVPVHVYGNLCDVEKIEKIASRHGLRVIYDAAHAFAEEYKGVSTAMFGDASMFSFHATKVFNTIEGGAVCTRDGKMAEMLSDMKNFGIRNAESCVFAGGNAKMNEFQAAMGICNLRHLSREIEKRKTAVLRYRENLSSVKGIRLCEPDPLVRPNYTYFPVVFTGGKTVRDRVFEELFKEEIIARKYFYPLTSDYECYAGMSDSRKETPVAKEIADSVLTLPLYADLPVSEVDRISGLVVRAL